MKLAFSNFENHPGLRYGLSSRPDGSMHRHLERQNREAYFQKAGIDPQRAVTPDLVHGAKVIKAGENMAGTMVPDADALVSAIPGLFISVTVADCFPVYLYDPRQGAVGIVHAGWRGTLKGIVPNTVRLMEQEFQTAPDSLLAAIGPGIRACHFSIDGTTIPLYSEYETFLSQRGEIVFADLAGIIKDQLSTCGLKDGHIADSGLCTFCDPKEYFSYRRDKPAEVESMMAYIGLD